MAIFPLHALWDAGTAARVAGAAHDRAIFPDQLADDDVVALATVLRETLGRVDFAVAGWRGSGDQLQLLCSILAISFAAPIEL